MMTVDRFHIIQRESKLIVAYAGQWQAVGWVMGFDSQQG